MWCTISLLRIRMIILDRKIIGTCVVSWLVILDTSVFEIHCTEGHQNFCLWICIYLLGNYLETCLSESLVNLEGLTSCCYLNFFPWKVTWGPGYCSELIRLLEGVISYKHLLVLTMQTSLNSELFPWRKRHMAAQMGLPKYIILG